VSRSSSDLVSVIIPSYNKAAYIHEAVSSVLRQTYPSIEVIVIDDGSTDGSWKAVRSFGERIRAERTENHGACHARNLGASKARGRYLMFLDADDVLGSEVVSGLVGAVSDDDPTIGICEWAFLRRAGTDQWRLEEPAQGISPLPTDLLRAWLEGWFVPSCAVLWASRGYECLGGWDERLRANQDGDLMLRALLAGFHLAVSPVGRAYYRRDEHGRSVSTRLDVSTFVSRRRVLDKLMVRLEADGRLERYRTALGGAYYGLARSHFGDVPYSLISQTIQQGVALAGTRALPRSVPHLVTYRIAGVRGLVFGGRALARLRSAFGRDGARGAAHIHGGRAP